MESLALGPQGNVQYQGDSGIKGVRVREVSLCIHNYKLFNLTFILIKSYVKGTQAISPICYTYKMFHQWIVIKLHVNTNEQKIISFLFVFNNKAVLKSIVHLNNVLPINKTDKC